ncbi:MAG TPA: response regulator [Stellaceae bacterium]
MDRHRRSKILAVDDDEAVLDVAVEILRSAGYEVVGVTNACRALEVIAETPEIDLLFTDIVMPGELHGFALAEKARQLRPDLPIVYASGYCDFFDRRSLAAPSGPFIPKPYRPRSLLSEIARALWASPRP